MPERGEAAFFVYPAGRLRSGSEAQPPQSGDVAAVLM